MEKSRLITIAKAVKKKVDDKPCYVDRTTRYDRKTELKMDFVLIRADNGYFHITKDEVIKEILEQTEIFKKHQQVIYLY